MRRLAPASLVLALGLVVCPPVSAAGKTKAPGAAALLGTLEGWRDGGLLVIGGVAKGRGWLSGERARDLARKGDPIAVYDLQAGLIGRARLTSDGKLSPDEVPSREFVYGGCYDVRLDADLHKQLSNASEWGGNGSTPVGVWHSSSNPEPRWVKAALLDAKNRAYREIISDWLAAKSVRRAVIAKVVVDQIVRADINGDKRDEVFLAFRTPEMVFPTGRRSTKTAFSYLVMRYLPKGARRARTLVLEDWADFVHSVIGICDLDRDGRAEVATTSSGIDVCGTSLHHWVAGRFRKVYGWGAGV